MKSSYQNTDSQSEIFNTESVPQELRDKPQWVGYLLVPKNDGTKKSNKPPINAKTLRAASSTKPETWSTYSQAVAAIGKIGTDSKGNTGKIPGVGFVFCDDYLGTDLDDAVDLSSGQILPWAQAVLNRIGPTYVEVSVSRTGLHIISYGRLPEGNTGTSKKYGEGKLEIYSVGRFFTFTGWALEGMTTITDQSGPILELYREIKPAEASQAKPVPPVSAVDFDIEDRLTIALRDKKFAKLFADGDISEYDDDDSRADSALCFKAAFYFERNAEVMDQIFRRSKLMRQKWEREDYRSGTIRNAITHVGETYGSRLILDRADPMKSAGTFLQQHHVDDGVFTLRHQAGEFWKYNLSRNCYEPVEEMVLKAELWRYTDKAWTSARDGMLVPFKPTRDTTGNLMEALAAHTILPSSNGEACWIDPQKDDPPPGEIIALKNGLLHVPERRLLLGTPRYFTRNGIDSLFNAKAPAPTLFLKFLSQLWPNDKESIAMLQEWIGLLLTLITRYQKGLLLIGPKRAGKGVIAKIVELLVGLLNVCSPSLKDFASDFGLQTLIGKTVAIVADARISGKTDPAAVTERLLSIVGEDTLSIQRKHRDAWTGQLRTRVMILSNELPRIEDQSGAWASRFVVLTLTESFYGREDHDLINNLIPELPGILLWALDGLDRLTERNRFEQPASAADAIKDLEDLSSPINAFLTGHCAIDPAFEAECDVLFTTWIAWCKYNGREHPGTTASFGRNLRTVLPKLTTVKHPVKEVEERTNARGVKEQVVVRDEPAVRFYQGLKVIKQPKERF